MLKLPTVVLRHHLGQQGHYDWLLGDPDDPTGRLFTLRIPLPPDHWPHARTWLGERLPPHRRHYLRYQGPIAPAPDTPDQSRGRVQRIARGHHLPLRWTPGDRIILVHLPPAEPLRIRLNPLPGQPERIRCALL